MKKSYDRLAWKIANRIGYIDYTYTPKGYYETYEDTNFTVNAINGVVKINNNFYDVRFFKIRTDYDEMLNIETFRYFAVIYEKGYGINRRGIHYKKRKIVNIFEFNNADEGNREYLKILATNPTKKRASFINDNDIRQYTDVTYTWNINI